MSKYKNLFVNIGLFALNVFATKLISFLLVPLYTYYMTQSDFGATDLAITVISMLYPLATLSISDATLRFSIDDKNNSEDYVSIGFWITVASCLLVALCLPALDAPFFGGLGHFKLLFWLSFVTMGLTSFFGYVARALNQIKLITVASVVISLITCGGAVTFIAWMNLGATGYFLSLIAGNGIGTLVYLLGGKQYRWITMNAMAAFHSKETLRRMFIYCVPLIPNALFWWMSTSINRFFITGMLGIAASGLFAAASKIPNLLNLVYSIFQQAWQLSAFQEFKSKDIASFFGTVFRLLSALLVVGSSLLILISPGLASLLLQKGFRAGWTLIPLMLLAFYFNILNSFYGTIYTASMKTQYLFTSTVAGALLTTILTWVLIIPLGLVGACWAMVIGNAAVFVLRAINSRKIMRLSVPWVTFWVSSLVLVSQSVVESYQVPDYALWSFALFICLIGINILSMIPTICILIHKIREIHEDKTVNVLVYKR